MLKKCIKLDQKRGIKSMLSQKIRAGGLSDFSVCCCLNIKFVFLPKRICISAVSRSEGFVFPERYMVLGEK